MSLFLLQQIGKPVTFSVDATEAGEGTLELVVSTEQSTVKAEVVAMSRGLYDVTFVPHSLLSHFVNISFNEQDVPGKIKKKKKVRIHICVITFQRVGLLPGTISSTEPVR